MAIQFNADALSRFSNVNFGNDNAIANLGDNDGLVQKKELGSIFLKPFRLPSTRERNNAVRTELLKALGRAFDLNGFSEANGTFTDEFMDRLEKLLGPETFKRDDFGIKGGEVKSGKPLTQRRITAIVNAARAKGEAAVDEPNDDDSDFIDIKEAPKSAKEIKSAKESEPVLDKALTAKIDEYRTKHGDLVADTVLATVKAMGGQVAPEDLEDIPAEELKRIEDNSFAYGDFDTSGHAYPQNGESPGAAMCIAQFEKMRAEADRRLKQLYPNGAGSPAMAAIKKNLIIQYSIIKMDSSSKLSTYGLYMKNNYEDLIQDDRSKDMMNLVVPTFETHPRMIGLFRHIRPRENA